MQRVSRWRSRRGVLLVTLGGLSALLLWSSAGARAATTWTVNRKGDITSGSCPAVCTLRHAVAVATAGDTIVVPSGTYMLHHHYITLAANVTIKGAGAGHVTINGNGGRIFLVGTGATVSISGVTVENGFFDGNGGAILNDGTLILRNSVVGGSRANGDGAGIFSAGTLDVIGSTISGNNGPEGAGIASAGTLSILTSTISGNTASGGGGGIFNTGSMTILASTVTQNTAGGPGGGIQEEGGSADSITNSTITANTTAGSPGSKGGGIYDDNASSGLTMTNDTIVVNSAPDAANVYFNNLGVGGSRTRSWRRRSGAGATATTAWASPPRWATTSRTTPVPSLHPAAASPPRPTSRASIRSSGHWLPTAARRRRWRYWPQARRSTTQRR